MRPGLREWTGALGLAVFSLFAEPAAAQTPEQVNQSIRRGIDFLRSRQNADGSWPEYGAYPGGVSALVTLALLSCDVPPEDPRIQRALKYLRTIEPGHTYVVALQTMVFAEAAPKDPIILRNARWLMLIRLAGGRWSYGSRGQDFSGDNSNTQFALLGLWAASEAGVEIPADFWRECRSHWEQSQSSVGSWDYRGKGAVASMTVGGISSLVITSRELKAVRPGVYKGKPVACNGPAENRRLDNAIRWLGRNFSVTDNRGGSIQWLYYYLYGLERAGRLTGRRFFGDHDWYREGVRFLLSQQQIDGSWTNGPLQLVNTPFALLFLSKGRIPIVVNKLQYGHNEDWNNAPNDVHNLTGFLAKHWNVRLNWQIVDVQAARVEDLLQAPVLQFSGHAAPEFNPREKELLRQYVEQGGLLMVDANCSVTDFDAGFRALCKELFPEPGQDLRRLEPGHGVWTSLFPLEGLAQSWPLYGIDVGCRTAVFYSSQDLSCQWEHQDDATSLRAFRLGANIVAYATGPENLQDKLEDRKVVVAAEEDKIRRGFLQIAKLRHSGDWNPAPRAIRNLMTSLREVAKIDVVRQQRDLEVLDPNLLNYPLVYMHGRNAFAFSAKEKDALGKYLRSGGVLFADACCGSEKFDQAFRNLVRELFPDAELKPIPVDHEMFTKKIGYDVTRVKYSKALAGREGPPALEGVELGSRYAVIYSKHDVGCALERQRSTDCKGYDHDSAVQLATNVVLYSLVQ